MDATKQVIDKVRIKAPGTLMLTGEHAVLHGQYALACAVNQYVEVRIRRRADSLVTVTSSLGNYSFSLKENTPVFPEYLSFAGVALKRYLSDITAGIDVEIESDFSSTVGLGSSAAVTVGITAGMRALCGMSIEPAEIFNDAYKTVLEVQGRGSGTDVAACILGGITRYRMAPMSMESVPVGLPLILVYCGYKTPTPIVIERIETQRKNFPQVYHEIFKAIGVCSEAGWLAVQEEDFDAFGAWLDRNQELMRMMALNTPELDQIVTALRTLPGVKGAKITGSGLGDCALAVGKGCWSQKEFSAIPVEISRKGVTIDC